MEGKCVHDRLYIDCGECRAAAVRKGFEYAESPEGKAEAEEHQRMVRLGRCMEQALDAVENARAHVKAGTKVSSAIALALEDACSRLYNLEQAVNRESLGMLRNQIERQVRQVGDRFLGGSPGEYVAGK